MKQESWKAGKDLRRRAVTQRIIGAPIAAEFALSVISIVVELKAIRALEDTHFAIGRSYLQATALHDGLLLNFATSPLTIKRSAESSPAHNQPMKSSSNPFLIS